MARSNGPILKRCRSLDIDPTYLGYSKKSKKVNKNSHRKVSEYGLQLREKQKTKFVYGVLERQFRKYFEMASRKKGITGHELLKILESRIDNVVFRMGIANTRPQARQLVTHGMIAVNGNKVDIASYLVKPGDVVSVLENKKNNPVIKDAVEKGAGRVVPEWLDFDPKTLSAKVLREVNREEIDVPVEEHLIVELYNK